MAGIAKSTITPDYKTTLYTMGLTKGFHSPHRKPPGKQPNPTADQPHEQCSHPPPPRLWFPAIILGTESHGGNSKEHNYP